MPFFPRLTPMARVVVDVMPKPEILDPQGKAVTGALGRLGFSGIAVRQGKRFEIEVDGEVTAERLADIDRAASTLLANTVIETYDVRVEDDVVGHGRRRRADRARRHRPPGPHDRPPERGARLMAPRIGVVTFPGSLDDHDALRAVRLSPAPRRSRSGTAATASTASTRWCCPAASPTATTCAAARSPASRP